MSVRSEKYVLFTQEEHENIRWDFTRGKIDKVVMLWEAGQSYDEIATQTFLKKIEVMLILMDKAHLNKVPARTGGLRGNRGGVKFKINTRRNV